MPKRCAKGRRVGNQLRNGRLGANSRSRVAAGAANRLVVVLSRTLFREALLSPKLGVVEARAEQKNAGEQEAKRRRWEKIVTLVES